MKSFNEWPVVKAIKSVVKFILLVVQQITDTLNDPRADAQGNHKFSHKRLMAVALVVSGLYLIFKPRGWLDVIVGCGLILGAIILAVVSAATKT